MKLHRDNLVFYTSRIGIINPGHRGGNHPVKELHTGQVLITAQNHGYAVEKDSLKGTSLEITHINLLDGTVEGCECIEDKVISVQFHPESAPGPQDSIWVIAASVAGIYDSYSCAVGKGYELMAEADSEHRDFPSELADGLCHFRHVFRRPRSV